MKDAVIVQRVSSKDQEDEGYSLQAQQRLLNEYAERKGFNIKQSFSIYETASKKDQRKKFDKIIAFVKKSGIQILIFEKVDRLTRNLSTGVEIYDWLEANEERELHCVKDSIILTKNSKSQDKINFDMRVVMAKNYADNLSEEVKKGYGEKLQLNKYPGKPPLGYKSIGEDKKDLIPDEQVAPFIVEAFKLYATGEYSLERISNVLYEKGLRSKKKGNKIGKSTWFRVINDPVYYGDFRWNGKLYRDAPHKPLITKELFDKCQSLLKRKPDAKYSKHNYLFKGLFCCGECHGTVPWYAKKGYVYGSCSHYRPCNQKTCAREDLVEEELAQILSSAEIKNERLCNWMREALMEERKQNGELQEASLNDINKRNSQITSMLDTLYNDRLSGEITIDFYKVKKEELLSEQNELNGQIKTIQKRANKERELGIALFELSQKGRRAYDKASPDEKRSYMNLVFHSMELKDGKVSFGLKTWFILLQKLAKEVNKSSKMENFEESVNEILEQAKNVYATIENGSSQASCFKWRRSWDKIRTLLNKKL